MFLLKFDKNIFYDLKKNSTSELSRFDPNHILNK